MAELHSTVPLPKTKTEQTAIVLRVPDELLLRIAFRIAGSDRNTDLVNLALAHRRFRNVVHEVLVRTGVVPLRSIPNYIVLLAKRLDWASGLTRIELGDEKSLYAPGPVVSREAVDVSLAVIRTMWPHDIAFQNWIEAEFHRDRHLPEYWIYFMFAALPHMKQLSVKLSASGSGYLSPYRALLHGPNGGSTFQAWLEDGLEMLSIAAGSPSVGDLIISVRHLRNLKSLSVPGHLLQEPDRPQVVSTSTGPQICLGFNPGNIRNKPMWTLPPDLEVLEIYCAQGTCPWKFLYEVRRMKVEDGAFGRLQQLRLFFSVSDQSLAQCLTDRLVEPVRVLQDWINTGASLETFILKDGSRGRAEPDQNHYKQVRIVHEVEPVQDGPWAWADLGS